MKKIFVIITLLLLLSACKNGPQLMPSVVGKAGEVLVVADKIYTDGAYGDAIRELLAKDYFALPQAEPTFDLITVHWAAYSRFFEPHRNQIKLFISSEYQEAKLSVQYNVAAAPQIVINVTAADDESAAELVRAKIDLIVELLEQAERNRTLDNAGKYPEANTYQEVANLFGGSLTFPTGYRVTGIKTDNFVYVINNIKKAMCGILVFSYPYTGSENINLEQMIKLQNEILKANMPSSAEGSYMKINTELVPSLRFLRRDDFRFTEMRGLWDVENGFMGGPFVSHSFLDKEEKNVIVAMAFVYAPNQDKRNYIRQAEALLYSWEWSNLKKEQK